MLLDSLVEALLLGEEVGQTAAMQGPPDEVAEKGADEPAGGHAGAGGQAQRHHRVEGDDAHDGVLEGGVGGQRGHGGGRCGDGAEHGGDEGVAPAGSAQLEERVPVEGL